VLEEREELGLGRRSSADSEVLGRVIGIIAGGGPGDGGRGG